MRRVDLTFSALLLPLDFAAFMAASFTAYSLRTSKAFLELRPILQEIPASQYALLSFGFAVIGLILFTIAGLYSLKPRRAWHQFGRIILSCTASIMVVIAILFFRREVTASRFLVLAVWPLSIFFTSIGRAILRAIRRAIIRSGFGHQRVVVIGQSKVANDLIKFYRDNPVEGYTVVKTFKTWNSDTHEDLVRLAQERRVDGVLLADPELAKNKALDLINIVEEHHLTFRYLADLFAARFTRIDVSTAGGVPIIEVKRTPLDGWGRIIKRLFDVTVATIALVLTSPLTLLSALIIFIQDGAPVIFQNERIGESARPFRVYKLRSMWKKDCIGPQFTKSLKQNIEKEQQLIKEKSLKQGPVYKIGDDPRVTPFGRFIRRWSIDELPQFLNVLRGDMSIVGPRPHQPREVAKYESRHLRVLAIKPGITGMAQISGRSDLDFEDEVRLDVWYIENWSLWLDVYILLKTPFVVLANKGAY
jgi:exopolysaccharide biosynthesis polyprenyl glycosylphosphotransferase